MGYRHILLAVDFSGGSAQVAARAVELARCSGARLSLIHVVEYLPMALDNEVMLPPALDVEAQLLRRAERELARLAGAVGAGEAARHVVLGSTRGEIVRYAEEQGVDLIVLGSHGRHGWARVLGSTAQSVVHAAPCDVLAVRVHREGAGETAEAGGRGG